MKTKQANVDPLAFEDPIENYDPVVYDDSLQRALAEHPIEQIQSQPCLQIPSSTTVFRSDAETA